MKKIETYDIINAGPNNRFMANGRIVSNSGRIVQLQNLYRNSLPDLDQARGLVRDGNYEALATLYDSVPGVLAECVRTAFVPREGNLFYVADFSAIEARVIAWLAGEKWRQKAFAEGKDIYCASASQMFGVPVEKHGVNGHLRQKGKIAELALGYGGSVGALTAMGALNMGLKEEELQPLVDAWRKANPNIVCLWWDVDKAIKDTIKERNKRETHGLRIKYQDDKLFIRLPSGRQLCYIEPDLGTNNFGGESVTYMGMDVTRHWSTVESYGPKFVENCIGQGTLVITDRGLIPIEQIQKCDLIWDGEEFVSHEGLIYQGKKDVLNVNGIHMTPEHKILTERGWIESAKSTGLNWADVSLPYGFESGRKQSTGESAVAVPVHLWKGGGRTSEGAERQKDSSEIMRMYEGQVNQRSSENPRHEPSSSMGSMAQHEAEMHRSKTPCISQLWRKGHYCLRTLAGKLRELLGGHGGYLEERPGLRPNRQRQRIQSRKLQVGFKENKFEQPEIDSVYRWHAAVKSVKTDRNRKDDIIVPYESGMAYKVSIGSTEFKEHVYDIRNCGPRHRFVVWNGERALIVSNCVQGIARDILCFAMEQLKDYRIVAHVHDEVIIEAPDIPGTLDDICLKMSTVPPWAEGLQLRADGYCAPYYCKDN